ncbi:hypothetical protein SDC9_135122 [bioreactor metagenome]|uniref:Uncharacterized protein n=1 Tax=bioreactor metagenome TaxID=1076179 RepID=A0A645DFJ7_9ZZZZ
MHSHILRRYNRGGRFKKNVKRNGGKSSAERGAVISRPARAAVRALIEGTVIFACLRSADIKYSRRCVVRRSWKDIRVKVKDLDHFPCCLRVGLGVFKVCLRCLKDRRDIWVPPVGYDVDISGRRDDYALKIAGVRLFAPLPEHILVIGVLILQRFYAYQLLDLHCVEVDNVDVGAWVGNAAIALRPADRGDIELIVLEGDRADRASVNIFAVKVHARDYIEVGVKFDQLIF